MDMKTRSAQPSANGSFSAGANLNSPRPLLYFVRATDSMRGEGSMPITLAANLSARGSKTRPVPQPTSTMSFGANGTCEATRSSHCRMTAALWPRRGWWRPLSGQSSYALGIGRPYYHRCRRRQDLCVALDHRPGRHVWDFHCSRPGRTVSFRHAGDRWGPTGYLGIGVTQSSKNALLLPCPNP
jgi:hypothetical protein